MIDKRPDEIPDIQDDAIEIEVEIEEPLSNEEPCCRIIWGEDGQAIVECATPEDAELAAELLALAPVKVTTKESPEESIPSKGPPRGSEDSPEG